MASGGERSDSRRRVAVPLAVAAAVVAAIALIAWQGQAPDIPLLEDDGVLLAGEQSGPPTRFLRDEERAGDSDARPVPEVRSFRVGKLNRASRRVRVQTDGGYCSGDRRGTIERIDRFEIEKSESAITITLFVTQRRSAGTCARIAFGLVGRANLGGPLGDRTVLDGSANPPTKPRQTDFTFPSRWGPFS